MVKLEQRWIPDEKGTALYIRPTVIATEAALGVRPADEYLFYIILSPVGYYFQGGFKPVSLWVCDDHSRTAPGGTGEAKTGGNYAASMLANRTAREKGYEQVLWLDPEERQYIEELSAMNIFFVIGDKLVTPALSGGILRGITRKSILEMAADLGIAPEERRISIREITAGIESGKVREAFAVGTAAVVNPVGRIHYRGTDYVIGEKTGPWTQKIYDTLTGIQYGQIKDPYGWVYPVS
jgi:branched-chain amino acid aminotransferase